MKNVTYVSQKSQRFQKSQKCQESQKSQNSNNLVTEVKQSQVIKSQKSQKFQENKKKKKRDIFRFTYILPSWGFKPFSLLTYFSAWNNAEPFLVPGQWKLKPDWDYKNCISYSTDLLQIKVLWGQNKALVWGSDENIKWTSSILLES